MVGGTTGGDSSILGNGRSVCNGRARTILRPLIRDAGPGDARASHADVIRSDARDLHVAIEDIANFKPVGDAADDLAFDAQDRPVVAVGEHIAFPVVLLEGPSLVAIFERNEHPAFVLARDVRPWQPP